LRTDRFSRRVRHLSEAEELRLRSALQARDARIVGERASANAWRRARGYAEYPPGSPDHLTPIILLMLNTGMRKGEVFKLLWADIEFVAARLTVRGEGAKTGQTRYVPLNSEATRVLRAWQRASGRDEGLIFPGPDGQPMKDIKSAWKKLRKEAQLTDFRLHDHRHTFASNLVMNGEHLKTVSEFLGHTTTAMTERYSHLTPDVKVAAVEKLVRRGA